MLPVKKLVYDEVATNNYRKQELKKLEDEKKKVMAEYNGLINELNALKDTVSNTQDEYKIAYDKVCDIGNIGGTTINGSKEILESYQNMGVLITETADVINQINTLIKKYNNDYNAKKFSINNHKEYKEITEGVQTYE